ncbi:MAG: hypothetical protein KF715_12675 [Candidatus Didemnitutus sp.]|nr:hypothetical protein [Candidatus Didemnitutus sp.]
MLAESLLLVVLGAASPVAPGEPLRWSEVRVGLPREQVGELLGQPLLRNAARGYERWIYDDGCEVQFTRGTVSAWTAPRNAPPAGAPVSRREPAPSERRL